MHFSILAFGIWALTAHVFGYESNADRYPRTERIIFEYPTYTFCVTKTVFSVSSEVREQKDEPTKTYEQKLKKHCYDKTIEYTKNLEEADIQCGKNPRDCQSYTTSTDPDNYQSHLESVGNDADKRTLRNYARAMPINLRLDLTAKDIKVCKDSYGRFYGINSFFSKTCPLIAFGNKDNVLMKYSPTNPRELRWLLHNSTEKDFVRQAINTTSYKGVCRFASRKVTYLCGFPPFSPKDAMPSQGSNFLCPGTAEKSYQYKFDGLNDFYSNGTLDVDIADAFFRPTCYAALIFTIEQVPSGKPEITLTFNFNGQSPPNTVYNYENVKLAIMKDFKTDNFVRLEDSNIIKFQTDVTVDPQTLEFSMMLFVFALEDITLPKCYHLRTVNCQFHYNPYCDAGNNFQHTSVPKDMKLTKFGDYHCSRHFNFGPCAGKLEPLITLSCRCDSFMCDDPRKKSTLDSMRNISTALEENHTCFVSDNGKVRTTTSKNDAHCYMTLTQPHKDRKVHVLNFGVLSLKNFNSITDDILKCAPLEALEDGLFAPVPRNVRSCRVVKGTNSTQFQCCCIAMNKPCNTERVIRQFFSLQANVDLHSCQFRSQPTGVCAESRYNQFRCIGVFALTESNGFRNTKEDCVSSHLDNDRTDTLCRQYGNIINPHGGTCGMMAMYDMRGDYDVDETDLPIYVCCGDSYPAIEKTLRTKVLKRIGDFKNKE